MVTPSIHKPVLLNETLYGPKIAAGDVFVDGTVGGGGHSAEVARRFDKTVRLFCFDLDATALSAAKAAVEAAGGKDATFIKANFRDAAKILKERGVASVQRVLLDFGLRSDELETSGRGFSFQKDEPLLMTFDDAPKKETLTARDIVNDWNEEDLADALFGYGGERYSRRIASAIVESRKKGPIETTSELVAIIESAVPASYRRGRIHSATRTFQALRIVVNDELSAIEEGLASLFSLLAPGGRLAAISFHSLEDGIVKRFTRERAKSVGAVIVTKKPLIASHEECLINPRARSAKLRIIERTVVQPS